MYTCVCKPSFVLPHVVYTVLQYDTRVDRELYHMWNSTDLSLLSGYLNRKTPRLNNYTVNITNKTKCE